MRATRVLLLVCGCLSPAACSSLAQGVLDGGPGDAPLDGGDATTDLALPDAGTDLGDVAPDLGDVAPDLDAVDATADVTVVDVAPDRVAVDAAPDALADAPADAVDGSAMDAGADVVDVPPTADASDCGADALNCSGVCVADPRNDPRHCGRCGNACALAHVSVNVCYEGVSCAVGLCAPGFEDCDRAPANGCEVALSTDPTHCGACAVACAFPHARAACAGGACVMGACNAGFGDCNASPVDGCETSLLDSAAHCGACTTVCPARVRGAPVCAAGACELRCDDGFGDCNGASADGCETALAANPLHCGACGRVCGGGTGCAAGACVPIPTPRSLSPLSSATVTSQTPTLRWLNGPGASGAMVYLADNPSFTGASATPVVNGSSLRVDALAAGTWYWRVQGLSRTAGNLGAQASPSWQFVVGRRSAPVDRSFGSVPDFNRDGYGDFVAAAPDAAASAATSPPSTGRVRVYLGGPTGIAGASVQLQAGGRETESVSTTRFGAALANGGDTNGDGYLELLATAYADDGPRVYAYHGNSTSVGTVPLVRLDGDPGAVDFGRSLSGAGDVNGDGYADVIVGATGQAYVFYGTSSGLGSAGRTLLTGPFADDYGRAVAGAGDVNGDGYADVLVGAPAFSSNSGRFYLYLGSATGLITAPTHTVSGSLAGGRFGWSVACAGDVNADGYADVVIGAPDASGRGATRVYLGSSTALQGVGMIDHLPGASLGEFGGDVAGVGDVDGDGFGDVLVGAPGAGSGAAYLLRSGGSPNLAGAPLLLDPGARPPGVGGRFGAAVAALGDANRDGFMDFVVGAPCAPSAASCGSGLVYYFRGASPPAATHVDVFNTSDPAGAGFGGALAWRSMAPRPPTRFLLKNE